MKTVDRAVLDDVAGGHPICIAVVAVVGFAFGVGATLLYQNNG